MTQDELIRLARIGAEARLALLQSEIETIYLNFPDLRTGKAGDARRQNRPATAARAARPRRRGTMSAAARKAVSLAQKKRWAEWRRKHGKMA
jgi:hypothetical protein